MLTSSYNERRTARYNKFRNKSKLNLISLMDIFTILVFFLLVNSNESYKLPNHSEVKLPKSISKKYPEDNLIILITQKHIIVSGVKVLDINEIENNINKSRVIASLRDELLFHYNKMKKHLKNTQFTGFRVTIMGDEKIKFSLLRKILETCRKSKFTHIAFAAIQQPENHESTI